MLCDDANDGCSLESVSLEEAQGMDERPRTPMTPASELGFELMSLDQDVKNLNIYAKAAVVDLCAMMPHYELHIRATEMVFNELFTELNIPKFSEADQLAVTSGLTPGQEIDALIRSRSLCIPWGSENDEPGFHSIFGITKKREEIVMKLIDDDITGLVYEEMVVFLKGLQSNGVNLGVISTCEHARYMLEKARLAYLFQSIIDPKVMLEYRHRQKPSPDAFLKACSDIGVGTAETIIIESTSEGIQAAREGNFGLVIGMVHASAHHSFDTAMRDLANADFVTDDIRTVTMQTILAWYIKGVQKDSWKLSFNTYSPNLETTRETLTTVGNGYFSSRGCFELYSETHSSDPENTSYLVHYPGHYINGVYSRTLTNLNGEKVINTDLVNCPDWSMIRVSIGDEPFVSPLEQEILNYTHQLNLKTAVMERALTFLDKSGRISRIESSRLVSMDLTHVAAINFIFTAINYTDRVTIRSGVDCALKNNLVKRYTGLQNKHIHLVACGQPDPAGPFYVVAKVHTPATVISTSVRNNVRLTDNTGSHQVRSSGAMAKDKQVFEDFSAMVHAGGSLTLEKIVSVYTTRDAPDAKDGEALGATKYIYRKQSATFLDIKEESMRSITAFLHGNEEFGSYHVDGEHADVVKMSLKIIEDLHSYHRVLDPHRQAWQDIWDTTDLQIKGDRACQRITRIHTYNLFVTASSPHTSQHDAGILARGLHGEAYRGHVFWDELYAFPFYLSTYPDICKGHLLYRYNRLPAARCAAKKEKLRGAMFPWQSADTGEEVTQSVHFNPLTQKWHVDKSFRQKHVNIAVFYNAWLYQERSHDLEITDKVFEMMLSIALMWASKCELGEDGRYHIRSVMGPDDFHDSYNGEEGVSDNAYTNVMVVWLLKRTLEVMPKVPKQVVARSGLTNGDLEMFNDIIKRMFVSINAEGVLEQFAGFFSLPNLNMSVYNQNTTSLIRMDLVLQAEGKKIADYQILKQADALMLWYLLSTSEVFAIITDLGYTLPEGMDGKKLLKVNTDFYVPITNDGSMLSYLVHAHVAGELREAKDQWSWFTEASRSDIYNKVGTTGEGIHCSVMAGSLSFIETWFAGLQHISKGVWRIAPNLPSHWSSVTLRRRISGYVYSFKVSDTEVRILLEDDLVHGVDPVMFKITDTQVQPGPWVPVVIQYSSLCKMKEFYDLMHKTWHHRKVMSNNYFMGSILWDKKQLQILRWVHKTLTSLPVGENGKAKLWLSGGTKMECELSYEINELAKDICFLERGEAALVDLIKKDIPEFSEWLEKGLEFLKGISFKNWITDRDGTTNNYCGRYNSSVQSVYNSIWITRFALCCNKAVFITSAPLANPGIVNVSVNFEQAFAYSGSKGREYIDANGVRQSFGITEEETFKMRELNWRLSELCRQPEYTKFTMIGSGLQLKFAQTTVARQDISGTIRRKESEDFLEKIKEICEDISPNGFEVQDTKLDVEVMPLRSESSNLADLKGRGFDKGDGLIWLNDQLFLELDEGPNLITGDTSGDVPMVRECMRLCPENTYVIFVTQDKKLMKEVSELCPRSLFVPCPDMLCYLLSEAAKRYALATYPTKANKLFPL
eukprot:TRINITY_DN17561_c0_g1_i2.p1 TRINITY_DN17561_c0_g1~~TRINITY_DN17561_c0_g1_i2.p1  ORF type:complete len:1583 (+),score=421.81 TRINITY_DN17561_c0_g1_i2:66-4814(+)